MSAVLVSYGRRIGGSAVAVILDHSLFDFVPAVFWKVLAVTLTAVMLGWMGAIWFYGELKTVDIVGSLISAPIFAYMVHLWVVYGKNELPDD